MTIKRKKLLFIFGTRPEAIKMAPLIRYAQQDGIFEVAVCVTAQHREMLDQVLQFFGIIPDFDLNLMKPNQDLFDITTIGLNKLRDVITDSSPDLVLVQGDTTTAFIGALAGFYCKVKVAHIEAGLRSDDKSSPFPEEMYRILTGQLSNYHFAPTSRARENLERDNIQKNIHVVGNTVIDALFLGLDIIKASNEQEYFKKFKFLSFDRQIILITCHRRESFGKPLENICQAIDSLAKEHPNCQFVYPVHPNPNVRKVVDNYLNALTNVFLLDPLDYPSMIWLMEKSSIIITDSGGIQEEAPSLGKPILVARDVTERQEGIESGNAKLVGTVTKKIIEETRSLISDKAYYQSMAEAHNPYGDGRSCEYILKVLREDL